MSIVRSRAILAILLVSGVSCASAPKVPVFGTWRIVSYKSPSLSAASPVQSLAWVGASASFDQKDARVGGNRCSQPKYTAATLSASDFQQQFKVAPSAVGLSGDQIAAFKLDCGYDWGGPTNTLVLKSPDALVASVNGVIYELVKSDPIMK